jgi:methionyl-tRNA formyltransferase
MMRIEFLTQEDPNYVLPLFEEFFKSHAKDFDIVCVSCSRPMGNRPRLKLLRELAQLYRPLGMLQLLARTIACRVLSVLPLPADARHYYSIAQLCRAYKVAYRPIGNPNANATVSELTRRASDLIVSVACPFILKKPLLSLPPLGCINIHHAPLPRYKGMMPTFWQLYHGEKTVGLTIHYMAEKVDAGEAILQEELDVVPGETLDRLIRRSKRHAAHALARVLKLLETAESRTLPLNREAGTYFTFPTESEIREFHQRGLRTI